MQHTQRSSQAQTSIWTHTAKLIIHTRYQGFFFLFLHFSSILHPFHSFAFTSISALSPSLSSATSSPHPLFLSTGHYELPALTPGNYGNSFSLDYWRTLAGRVPSGDFITIIRCARTYGHVQVHTLIQ